MFMVRDNILFLYRVQATEPQQCDVYRETQHTDFKDRKVSGFSYRWEQRIDTEWQYSYVIPTT